MDIWDFFSKLSRYLSKRFLITLVILTILTFVFSSMIERAMAINAINRYMKAQGVEYIDIEEKKIFKDKKNGGYMMRVKYINDSGYTYYYHYIFHAKSKDENSKSSLVFLEVMHDKKVIDPPYEKVKYPPLKKWEGDQKFVF